MKQAILLLNRTITQSEFYSLLKNKIQMKHIILELEQVSQCLRLSPARREEQFYFVLKSRHGECPIDV